MGSGRIPPKALHWLRRTHILFGLQSAVALIVYAVSGLASTWHMRPGAPPAPRAIETRAFEPRAGENDVMLARRLHREMGFALTLPPEDWVIRREADGALTFRVYSPNGRQHFRVTGPGVVQLEDERFDLATFLLNLHAYTVPRPGSGEDVRLVLWSLYNELSMLALGGFALSGVVLWLTTRPRAALPLFAFVAGCSSCLWLAWSLR